MLNSPNINQSAMINKPVSKPVQAQSQTPAVSSVQQQQVPQYTTNIYPTETVPVYTKTATPTPTFSDPASTVKASIFYINDLHGQNIRMERLFNAVNQFDNSVKKDTDKMKFASGDIMLGEDEKHVKVADTFLNMAGFLALTMGNHECDLPTKDFVELINDKKYKLLGLNLNPTKDNPIHNYIEKSYVQEIGRASCRERV